MRLKFAPLFRACAVAGVLALSIAGAAERKGSLVGATRDEVLAKFGEPKSHIVAGSREVLFFQRERIVLRDGRVVEVEELPADLPPAPKPASKPAAAAESTDATAATTDTAPAKPAAPQAGAAPATSTTQADSTAATPTPPPVPEVQIKSVRPPSRSISSTSSSVAPTSPAPSAAPLSSVQEQKPEAPKREVTPAAGASAAAQSESAAPTPNPAVAAREQLSTPAPTETATPAAVVPTPTPPPEAVTDDVTVTPAKKAPVATAPAKASVRKQPSETTAPDATDSIFTVRTKVIAGIIIALGIGYLVWRRRQRQILLQATAVSHSPFAPEAAPVTAAAAGARFTGELLNQLEWKRFEELVASYYNKTGVVAVRTKSGPDAAVHIRISWKGEQRPFACVHCVAHPSDLVGPKSVQVLAEVLAAEDIRRGYIVTSGKFGVPARDLAEEKHITLLPGDIFLEKLNALPEPARAELLRDATTGDYTTPTCPKCDAKSVRMDIAAGWQCSQCGTVLPRS